jgi:hypothetical protein
MNQQILEDLKLASEPEIKPTAQLYIVRLLQKFFQTKEYYDRKWKEEKSHFDLLIAAVKKLAASYSLQELNDTFAEFKEGQLEFALLRLAINFKSDRQKKMSL